MLEDDAPCALAASAVGRIDSELAIEPVVADVTPDDVEPFVKQAQLVLDGTGTCKAAALLRIGATVRHIRAARL